MADSPNILQLVAWSAAGLAATVGGGNFIYTFFNRREDRQWEKVKKAEGLIADIYSNDYAHFALRMVDGSLVQLPLLPEFQIDKGVVRVVPITLELVRSALTTDMDFDEDKPAARTICHCFDTLFYQLNRLEFHLREELIDFEHIRWQLSYYMACIARSDGLFQTYIEAIAYPRVNDLIRRFVE